MLIKDICSSITDGSHNPPQGVTNSSFLMLSSKNVFDDEITLDEPRFLSEDDFEKENKRTKVKCGDVLLTIVGTVGRTAVVPNDFPPFTLQRSVAVLHPDENICSGRYLMYALRGKRSYIESHSKGVAQKGIYLKEVAGIDLPVPSKEIQEQIIEKLDKINLIIKLRKLEIENLDKLIKARFVELFGLPVSNSKKWDTEKMKDIAPAVNYSGDFEETVWLLNLDMVEAQTGRIIDYLYVSEDEVGNSTCTFDTSNVLYSKLRPYLNKVVIPDRCGYATSEMVPLKPNPSKIERTYLAFMLRSDEFVKMINEKVAGAKMPRVSMSDFREFNVPVPPMELQKQFAAFVEQTDKSKFKRAI